MDYAGFFRKRLDALRAEGRYRVFADLERRCGRFPRTYDHRIGAEVTVWCSNDYLGMGQHPAVLAAMEETLWLVGAGAGGTRNISGNSHVHLLLERELADLHGREAALIFTSGYVANDAALSTLARELAGMVVFSDAFNHASMIAGIRNSGAEKYIFRHNPANPSVSTYKNIDTFTGQCATTMPGQTASTQGNETITPVWNLTQFPCAADICGVPPVPAPNPIP
jgi:5-aminolevulinate synthase